MKSAQRYRLARTTLGLSLLVLLGSVATSISTAANQAGGSSNYTQILVMPGESLWSIAAMVAPDAQINSVVADIVEINKLSSADLSAGMKLLVPSK